MSKSDSERGSALVTVAVSVVVLVSFLALAVDIGAGYVERRRVQAVADSASLAGMQVLVDNNGTDAQILAVITEYVQVRNPLAANERREYTAQWLGGTTPLGVVGNGARPAGITGILVTVRGYVPTFFANIFNIMEVSAAAPGGGGYSPLDVVLVLDKSGSMDDDSCFLVSVAQGFSLKSYFDNSGQCSGVLTGDGLSSSNCSLCKGTYKTSPTKKCVWPGGSTMGSEVTAYCGSVQTNQTACQNCKGVWNTPNPEPVSDLKTAASGFVDLVQTQLAPTFPHMGLVTYSTNSTLNVQLTGTLSNVKSGVASITAGGYTDCEDGLYTAVAELTTSGRQRWIAVKAIVFMSDGKANLDRTCHTVGSCTQAKQRAIDEAQLAGTQGIAVYTIGLGSDADQDMLQQMVAAGGAYAYAPSSANLNAVFTAMFQKIKRLRLVQ